MLGGLGARSEPLQGYYAGKDSLRAMMNLKASTEMHKRCTSCAQRPVIPRVDFERSIKEKVLRAISEGFARGLTGRFFTAWTIKLAFGLVGCFGICFGYW